MISLLEECEQGRTQLKATPCKIDHNLLNTLYLGIQEAKKEWEIGKIIVLTILQAMIVAYINSLQFVIMKYVAENDIDAVIKWICIISALWCIKEFVDYYRFKVYQNEIIIELNRYFKNRFLEILFLKSNYDWLNCNKSSEINTAINSGTRALMSTLRFLTNVINPLFQAIGSLWAVSNHVGIRIISAAFVMTAVFFGGYKLVTWEYYQRGKINKHTNPMNAYNVHLANTALPEILNGRGQNIINTMLKNSTMNQENHTKISLETQKGYVALEIIGIITITMSVYFMSIDKNASTIVAINVVLNSVLEKMWWLFHMCHNASSSAADWATLEQYLKSVVFEEFKVKQCLHEYKLSSNYKYPHSKEERIVGRSGCGKSTWMLSEVIKLKRKYEVDWLYLDQRMVIPKTSCVTIREFICEYLKEFIVDKQYFLTLDSDILYWAKVLKLESVINENTLDSSFNSPSGGEEKRIIILQKFFPILTEKSRVKVIFADEISAGLDDTTHGIVRNLLEIMKTKYGIIIVNIDHHEYVSQDLIKIGVKKIGEQEYPFEYEESLPEKPNESCWSRNFLNFGKQLPDTKSKKKPTMPPKVELDSIYGTDENV